jgi:putative SOS response-associated peptidase YedK
MCTAYQIGPDASRAKLPALADFLAALASLPERLVRPTLEAPVMMPDGRLELMHWGFRRQFTAKLKGRPPLRRTIVNSREDKLAGPMWREAFQSRRCLVPATAFYEWTERQGRKLPLRFTRPDGRMIWIAGIWEEHPEHGRCHSMITTEPSAAIAPVHDRMPAVLPESAILPYLRHELHILGPSAVALEFHDAANFLKAPPAQGEWF